jgi:hypothetical protein
MAMPAPEVAAVRRKRACFRMALAPTDATGNRAFRAASRRGGGAPIAILAELSCL